MPLFLLNLNPEKDAKMKITDQLRKDWDGTDHPLWRNEAADKLSFAVETLLCIVAMAKKPTIEAQVAATALVYITDWTEEEFNQNVSDVMDRIVLANEQEGGMQ